MPNRVFRDPGGWIHVVCEGAQTGTTVRELGIRVRSLIESGESRPEETVILVDLSLTGPGDNDARREGSKLLHSVPFRRVAMFGASRVARHVIRLMLIAARLRDRVRLFDTKEAALSWLGSVGDADEAEGAVTIGGAPPPF